MTTDGALAGDGQACTLVGANSGPMDAEIAARVDTFTLAPAGAAGGLTSMVRGSAVSNQLTQINTPPSCAFEFGGPLTRDDAARPRCGDDRTAVGVWARSGVCPLRTGIDGVVIAMSNEPDSGCAAEAGDLGESGAITSSAVKSLPPCTPGAAPPTARPPRSTSAGWTARCSDRSPQTARRETVTPYSGWARTARPAV